jgi:DNA repair protein SbcC/Rad50
VTMQIAHLGLRNIRSYRAADLQLGPGTTLLSGDIGSGKTSLLYAIEMALLGFAEVEPGYLVRHGAKEAEVTLTLTDGSHRWELRRRFSRRARKGRDSFEPTENSLAVDGQRATYSATELRRRTIELLGFPDNPNPRAHSDVWRWAVYLAQERMRDVLDPDVDARMETVRKALGVEQYRLAGENARALARSLQERASDLAEQGARHRGVEEEAVRWRQDEDVARRQLAALNTREQELRDELGRARAALDGVELQRRTYESAREAVAHQERLANELERSVEQDRAAQQAAREHLARVEAERTLESSGTSPVDQPPHEMEPLRARREQLVRRLTDLEEIRGQASGVEEQLARGKDRDREVTARHEATREQLTKARTDQLHVGALEPIVEPRASDHRSHAELAADRSKLEEARRATDRLLTQAVAELQELAELVQQGVCPRCHRPVEPAEFESHRREQESRVSALQDELEAASKKVQAAEAAMLARLDYERARDRWEQLEARRADLRQRAAELEASSAEEERVMARLGEERAALEGRRQALSGQLEEVNRVREEITLVDGDLLREEERARKAAAQRERLAALERQVPEIRAEIENRERSEAERTARWNEVRREIEQAQNALRSAPDLEDRWKTARQRVDELGHSVEDVLREARGPHGKLAEASARLDELTRRLNERHELERQVTQLRRLTDWVDQDFRNAMIELERRRLHQGRNQFERRFAQYFAALVEDPALSARVDETFAPWVDIGGQATPAEALSGGERTALALAYRLALGRTVRDAGRLTLETLILDEPTEGFSQEQTLRMGDLLEGLGLPQVILVSHERQLEGIADRVVRVRKKDGVSFIEEGDRAAESEAPPAPSREAARTKPRVSPRRRRIRRLSDLEVVETGDGSAQAR